MPRAFSMSNVAAAAESCLQEFPKCARIGLPRSPATASAKEVIPAGVEVLQALAERDSEFSFTVETLPWGSDYYRETGRFMPEDGVATLRGFDAIYFGASATRTLPII